jgi:hypothetical protein
MSAGAAAWLAFGVLALALEWRAPQRGIRALAECIAMTRAGRVALVLVWGFLAIHLFARHGAPLS